MLTFQREAESRHNLFLTDKKTSKKKNLIMIDIYNYFGDLRNVFFLPSLQLHRLDGATESFEINKSNGQSSSSLPCRVENVMKYLVGKIVCNFLSIHSTEWRH